MVHVHNDIVFILNNLEVYIDVCNDLEHNSREKATEKQVNILMGSLHAAYARFYDMLSSLEMLKLDDAVKELSNVSWRSLKDAIEQLHTRAYFTYLLEYLRAHHYDRSLVVRIDQKMDRFLRDLSFSAREKELKIDQMDYSVLKLAHKYMGEKSHEVYGPELSGMIAFLAYFTGLMQIVQAELKAVYQAVMIIKMSPSTHLKAYKYVEQREGVEKAYRLLEHVKDVLK